MITRSCARLVILSAIALAGAGAANADVFLKIPSLQGGATQRGFEGQIEIAGASMSISSWTQPDPSGVGDTVRTATAGPIFITKSPDRSSPRLTAYALEGQPLGRIEITFTDDASNAITSKWIIDGAEVRSISVNPDPSNGYRPVENVEIAYAAMTYQYFDGRGGPKPVEEARFDAPADQLFPFDEGCR